MKHLKLSAILFALLASGCGIRPPDVPMCRDLPRISIITKDAFGVDTETIRPNPVCAKQIRESTCGECVWTISDKTQYVGENPNTWLDGEPWSKVKPASVLVPPKSQAKQKKFVLEICKKYPDNCEAQIPRWRVRADAVFGK